MERETRTGAATSVPRWFALALACALLGGSGSGRAATWTEMFGADPLHNGWRAHGDATLFRWNSSEQALQVTWDSRRTNSYFHRPLGTVVARDDDFSLGFDVRMDDLMIGVDPAKPDTFEIALGFINLADATRTNFFRGSGINATYGPRNLVEFDYFPDGGFGATFAPTVVSTNNRLVFSSNHPLELTPGDDFHIEMTYTAADLMLRTTVTRNGAPFGLPPGNTLRDLSLAGFPDFRVDTFAVCSYSDGQQPPPAEFAGSILAHGWVDNVQVMTPEPPLGAIAGTWSNQVWSVHFAGTANWRFALEQTGDLAQWTEVDARLLDEPGDVTLRHTNAPAAGTSFYRVRATRP